MIILYRYNTIIRLANNNTTIPAPVKISKHIVTVTKVMRKNNQTISKTIQRIQDSRHMKDNCGIARRMHYRFICVCVLDNIFCIAC